MFKRILEVIVLGIFLSFGGFQALSWSQMGAGHKDERIGIGHEQMGSGMMTKCGDMLKEMSRMMQKGKPSPEKLRKMADHLEKMASIG